MAAQADTPGATLASSLDSARLALEARDWQTAYDVLKPAVESGAALDPEILARYGYCCSKLCLIEEASRATERAFAGYVQAGENRPAALAAAHLVAFCEILGAESACRGWEQRGLRLIEDTGPCVEQGYLILCRTGCDVVDPRELEQRAEAALQLARTFGDTDLEIRARAEKGLALVGRGFVNAGFALLDEVMVSIASGEMRDEDMRGRTVCSLLSACDRTGDIGRAEDWCKRIEEEPGLQHVLLTTHCLVTYGMVDALRGEWQRAEDRLAAIMQAKLAIPYHRAVATGRLAEILIQQGKHQAAAEVLRGYEDRFEAMLALARIRMAEGRHDEAAALLRSLARGLAQDVIRVAPVLAELVVVELLRGQMDGASRAARSLHDLDQRCESNEIRAYAKLASGCLSRASGEIAGAIEDFETALTLLIHYERPLLAAQVRLQLARAFADAGEAGQGVAEAQAALATFSRLGVVGESASAEALLAALQRDTTPVNAPRASIGTRLTARESEVATLVALGLSNRQIAARLVLSVRTVEGHIDRILGKLDFHSRTQLAMWVGNSPDT